MLSSHLEKLRLRFALLEKGISIDGLYLWRFKDPGLSKICQSFGLGLKLKQGDRVFSLFGACAGLVLSRLWDPLKFKSCFLSTIFGIRPRTHFSAIE